MYVITSLAEGGGAEQQVRYLAQAFHRRGWDVGVVSMLPSTDQASVRELEAEGVRIATLGMRRGVPDPRALLKLRALLRRWRPDVLHGHMVHANLLIRLSRLVVGTPVLVSTMHNQNEGRQWRYIAYRLTDSLSDVTTAVSPEAAHEAVRRGAAPAGTIRVVPNGIRMSDYARDETARERVRASLGVTSRFVWLAAGRLVDAKGYPQMLSAFEQVHEIRPDAKLLVAGAGPLREQIARRISEAGLLDQVALLGFRRDVPTLMQGADAFVMSSLWEGLPMVLLQASASALPVVATDVGGSRAAVVHGVTGYIVPPDRPRALAEAMISVMALPRERATAMGETGRQHVSDTFDLDRVADSWEAIYAEHLRVPPIAESAGSTDLDS